MTDNAELCHNLQSLWHREFPITASMQLRILSYENHALTTVAPVDPNRNIHGTAFAGSLYAIEALTAWGLLYLEISAAGQDASIIHANGQIEFAEPVRDEIVTRADFSGCAHHLEELKASGKTRLELTSEVVANDAVVSRFSGLYVVRTNRERR